MMPLFSLCTRTDTNLHRTYAYVIEIMECTQQNYGMYTAKLWYVYLRVHLIAGDSTYPFCVRNDLKIK